MAQLAWYKRLSWIRVIFTGIALLVIAFCLGLIIYGSNSTNNDIAIGILAGITAVFALGQWFFPFSPKQSEASALPIARELVHQRASFRMGDTTAANFDYIKEPIKQAYDSARQALHDASVGAGSKRGILILGIANAGKTRLAFEALTQILPDWNVLLWNASYDTLSIVPVPTVSRGSGLVVFIDDLQEYVPAEGNDADGLGFLSDNRVATLQAFLHTMQIAEHFVVIATCRLEDEMRVGARLRWLFDQLKVITLQRFRVEVTDPELATIIGLFQQHGAIHVGDWDGTLGSLVLGLSKKKSQYEQLVQSHHPAVAVLRAMKLLSLAYMNVHTFTRIQGVCTGVFGESAMQGGSKLWQESVDLLTRLEFVTEEKDKVSGTYALAIRKDTYFDKVITDYPVSNRPYQLEQHFEQLQKVFMGLNDSLALVSLGNAQGDLKRYEEALAAFDQALRLNPNYASAYIAKGIALRYLKRNEEALAAFGRALRLGPDNASAYIARGLALGEFKRYEEALATYDQALRLDPNDADAYNGKGIALIYLTRYEEALTTYDQALRLDPNDAGAYNGKERILRMLEHEGEV